MSSEKKLKTIEKKRNNLLATLLESPPMMLRGTFSESYTRCGKVTCRCMREGQLHKSLRISWTENAISRTKSIPHDDKEWIQEMTENYRQFRKYRQQLRALDKQTKEILDRLEEKIIRKAKRKIDYL